MSESGLPLLLEANALERLLDEPSIRVVDLSGAATHARYHIPGAVHLDYGRLVATRTPVGGLLPGVSELEKLLGEAAIDDGTHVVAYDDEGGGKAGRLLWTLDVLGHKAFSMLNGGLHAWADEGHPMDNQRVAAPRRLFPARLDAHALADRKFIESKLGNPDVVLVDARSPEEYSGAKRLAAKAGHIPGAVNWDWVQLMDRGRNLRLKPAEELHEEMARLGIDRERQVVTYCQTHHRSSLTYTALKCLGFPRVKGYPGSWSEWGNLPDTPVE